MKTLIEVLNSGTEFLTKHGTAEPRATMQHLMAHVLQCNRTSLYLQFDKQITEEQLIPLRELLKRRVAGEPLQHLLGSTEFFRREFLTDARALIPRPETEELIEYTLNRLPKQRPLRILDMGTGSGIIGITLGLELKDQISEVVLADISDQALSLALENAIRLGCKVSTRQTDLFSDLYETVSSTGEEDAKSEGEISRVPMQFDVIMANLPYIKDDEKLDDDVLQDPHTALFGGPLGWEIIDRFLAQARNHLTEDGLIALEIGYDQSEIVSQMMYGYGYNYIEVLKDMCGIARFPIAYK